SARSVTLMMLKKVKTKITRTEVFANQLRVPQHSQITLTHLRHASIDPRFEHVAGDNCGFQSLHRFVTQHPGFPVKTDMRYVSDLDARLFKAVLHRVVRKTTMVFPSRKAFLFGSCDN